MIYQTSLRFGLEKMLDESQAFFGGDKGILLSYGSKQNVCIKDMLFAILRSPLKNMPRRGIFFYALGSHPPFGVVKTKKAVSSTAFSLFGGDKGIRTPDLYDANVSLYQLSHIPKHLCIIIHCLFEIKRFFGILFCAQVTVL